jgi:hypothetical protein
MTSPEKIAANRKNALQSTGPQSLEGKRRASANSLRHGIARRAFSAEENLTIQKIVNDLTKGTNDYWAAEAARQVAESFVGLERIRFAVGQISLFRGDDRCFDLFSLPRQLRTLSAYERKARSRYRTSMRNFFSCLDRLQMV